MGNGSLKEYIESVSPSEKGMGPGKQTTILVILVPLHPYTYLVGMLGAWPPVESILFRCHGDALGELLTWLPFGGRGGSGGGMGSSGGSVILWE